MLGNLRYMIRLAGDVLGRPGRRQAGRAPIGLFILGLGLVTLAGAADRIAATGPSPSAELTALQMRTSFVQRHLAAVATQAEAQLAPLVDVLLDYRDDEELTRRIAIALVREGRQTGVDPRMLLAVLLVENPWLNPTAQSSVGAVGLMQVMPFHAGEWEPCAPTLDDVDANICHGARIFAHYLGATNGNLDRALLRYNGCVTGENTPDCDRYPTKVFARAGRATLAGLTVRPTSAASR